MFQHYACVSVNISVYVNTLTLTLLNRTLFIIMGKHITDESACHYAQQLVSFGCSASFCRIYDEFCSLSIWFCE